MIELSPYFIECFVSLMILYVPLKLFSRLENETYLWDCFTRVGSTINAILCVKFVINHVSYDYYDFYHYDIVLIKSLYIFAAYLFTDGILQLPIRLNIHEITSVLHHFVGAIGIYMMAERRVGLGLGLYFGATELSTPLMNLSWLLYTNKIHSNLVFGSLYSVFFVSRILTIPFLVKYLYINFSPIRESGWSNFILGFGGSSILILLNIIWFLMLTKKILNHKSRS